MFCDKCKKNEAIVHSTYNINGEVFESHLCKECVKKENRNSFGGFDSFFSDLASNFYYPISEIRGEINCNRCGTTFSEFKKTGRLGCQECYKTFKKYIDQIIESSQYGSIHNGKTVEELDARDRKIIDLQLKLKRAVEEENYELASEIKKKMQSLKEGE